MTDEQLRRIAEARAVQKAKAQVVERLALASFVIWSLGALAYYILVLVPFAARPSWGMLGGLVLLLPAALPWLAYRRLVASGVHGRVDAELRALQQAQQPAARQDHRP